MLETTVHNTLKPLTYLSPAAAVLLPGLMDALLSHLALRLLLQLRVEFLDQPLKALHFLVLGLTTLPLALHPDTY